MRTSILGCHRYDNLEEVRKNTINICNVTHADPRCQASCLAVTLTIANMLQHGARDKETIRTIVNNVESNIISMNLMHDDHVKEFKEYFVKESSPSALRSLNLHDESSIGYSSAFPKFNDLK